MKTPFSLFLALRYLKPKRTFVSIITLISIIGVMLGITVLILVISVMTGFDKELRDKVLGFEPHILLSNSDQIVPNWQKVLKQVEANPEVVAVSPFVQGPVIVEARNGHDVQRLAPFIRGIDPSVEEKVTNIAQFVKEGYGEFDLSGNSTVIGIDLARTLRVGVGDTLTIYSPGNVGNLLDAIEEAENNPEKTKELKELLLPAEVTITGIFNTGRHMYDQQFLLIPLHLGQELYGLDSEDHVHGIAIRTVNPKKATEIRDTLHETLDDPDLRGKTWEEMNETLFEAIAMERNVMFFLLLFIIIVAAFGIMNTLITVTVQKTREIGVMKALGARTNQIVGIFLMQGMVVGVFGNIAGIALGMTLVSYRNEFKDWLAARLGIQVFPADIYHFSRIPAEVVPRDVAIICLSAFIICSLAALIPAYFAARLDPVKALRQE